MNDPNKPHYTVLLDYITRKDGKKFKMKDGALTEVRTLAAGSSEVEFVEKYRNHNIVFDGCTVMVHNPEKDTLFVVALDDSKTNGKRVFADEFNTVEEARKYIDWVTEK